MVCRREGNLILTALIQGERWVIKKIHLLLHCDKLVSSTRVGKVGSTLLQSELSRFSFEHCAPETLLYCYTARFPVDRLGGATACTRHDLCSHVNSWNENCQCGRALC